MRSSRAQIVAAFVAAFSCMTAIALFVARSDDPAPTPVATPSATSLATSLEPTPTHTASAPLVDPGAVGVATTRGATVVRSEPSLEAPESGRLRGGITLPVTDESEGFFAVLTPCEVRGWVASADVDTHPRATGTPRTLGEATIVIDPGHGGRLPGSVGPTGLAEKEPNTDIALRLAKRLEGARVFLTRSTDITAGLGYRAAIANSLGAHVFVSVHNNADPDGAADEPGTETYYQYASAGSKRLAGLFYEELFPILATYDVAWMADRDAGAKYRLNSSGTDYYALLRRSRVPTVIVEALYLANRPEEDLLRRPEVREAVAGALAKGLRRYFGTADPGSGFIEPYPRPPGPSGRLPSTCTDPAPL